MKNHRYFITAIFILSLSFSFGQDREAGKVVYKDIQSLRAPGANLLAYNAVLYFTPNKAIYVTKVDSLEGGGKQISKTIRNEDDGVQAINSSSLAHGLFNITDRKEKRLISNARFAYGFTHSEPLPGINWEITDETREIEGIEVVRANTSFRGRDYTAWFAPEIAVPLGPWKLHGLPGLILEAYDNEKEIMFVFQKLEIPYKGEINFPKPQHDLPNLNDLKKKQADNFRKNIRMQRAMAQKHGGTSNEDADLKEKKKRYLEIFE